MLDSQAQERVGDGNPAGEDDGGGGEPFVRSAPVRDRDVDR